MKYLSAKSILFLIILIAIGCSGEKIYKRKEESGRFHYIKIKLSERKLNVISYYQDDKIIPQFVEVNDCIVVDKNNWKCGNIHLVNDELFLNVYGEKHVYK